MSTFSCRFVGGHCYLFSSSLLCRSVYVKFFVRSTFLIPLVCGHYVLFSYITVCKCVSDGVMNVKFLLTPSVLGRVFILFCSFVDFCTALGTPVGIKIVKTLVINLLTFIDPF